MERLLDAVVSLLVIMCHWLYSYTRTHRLLHAELHADMLLLFSAKVVLIMRLYTDRL